MTENQMSQADQELRLLIGGLQVTVISLREQVRQLERQIADLVVPADTKQDETE